MGRIYVDYIISERISQDTFGIFYRNRAGDARAVRKKTKKALKNLFLQKIPLYKQHENNHASLLETPIDLYFIL